MSQQPPPAWGSLPPAPPTQCGGLPSSRAGDVAAAWVLWTLLLVGCLLTWVVMLVSGVAVGIGCSSGSTVEQVCRGSAADVAEAGYFVMWAVMAVAVIGSLVATVVQTSRRRLAWVWPAAGIGLVTGSFLLWWLVYEIAS
jgi:hypothetical protein